MLCYAILYYNIIDSGPSAKTPLVPTLSGCR